MLSKITEACHYLLNNYPEAQTCKEYLDKRLSKESQELFQFGYFPDMNNIQALTSIVGEDVLFKYELLYGKEIEDSLFPRTINFSFFENYPLVMPYKNSYGEIVALVGRTLIPEKNRKIPKYKNTIFKKSMNLFGLYENKKQILKNGCVFIVEGQFDTIKAVESGMYNIVSLGSAGMSAYQFSVISRYTNNIILLLDNDEAGEKGRELIMKKFGKLAGIRNFYIPQPYKDIDEYLSCNTLESLSFLVKD